MAFQKLLLTLVVAAQFALAPLASLDPCWIAAAFGSEGCCCEAAVSEAAVVKSCCEVEDGTPAATDEATSMARTRAGLACGCVVVPVPSPTNPLPGSVTLELELSAAAPSEDPWLAARAPEVAAQRGAPVHAPPGAARPLHLLHQVFRL